MAKRRRRTPCPECGRPLPPGKEDGPCRHCGWVWEEEEEGPRRGRKSQGGPAGRSRAGSRRRTKKGGPSPVLLGVGLGVGGALLLLLLLSLLGGGKKGRPQARPASAGERSAQAPSARPKAPEKAPEKKEPAWEERLAWFRSALDRTRRLTPGMKERIRSFLEEARRKGREKEARPLLDRWIALDPADEEARKLRGDVLYTGPFRKRRPDGTWAWPFDAKSGRKAKIWITREDARAMEADPLYREALQAVETAKRIDGAQENPKKYWTWCFFDDDVAPRPFIVFSQSKTPSFAKDRAKSVVRTISCLRRTMLADYYEPMHKIHGNKEFLTPIFVFGGQEVYGEFRDRSTIKGLPDPAMAAGFFSYSPELKPVGWLFVWSENPESSFFKDVISHEGTHLLQFQYGKRTSAFLHSDGTTTWFQEGLAEYWGGHKIVRVDDLEVFLPGRIQEGRLQALWRHLPTLPDAIPDEDPRFLPLRRLIRMSYMDYNLTYNIPASKGDPTAREMVSVVYAEGWAFVHFLFHYQNGKYRKALLRYMETELAADFKWRVLERGLGVHGRKGWLEITGRFIDYVRTNLWKIYQDPKSGGFGPWADAEARRLAKAVRRAQKKASRRKAPR